MGQDGCIHPYPIVYGHILKLFLKKNSICTYCLAFKRPKYISYMERGRSGARRVIGPQWEGPALATGPVNLKGIHVELHAFRNRSGPRSLGPSPWAWYATGL